MVSTAWWLSTWCSLLAAWSARFINFISTCTAIDFSSNPHSLFYCLLPNMLHNGLSENSTSYGYYQVQPYCTSKFLLIIQQYLCHPYLNSFYEGDLINNTGCVWGTTQSPRDGITNIQHGHTLVQELKCTLDNEQNILILLSFMKSSKFHQNVWKYGISWWFIQKELFPSKWSLTPLVKCGFWISNWSMIKDMAFDGSMAVVVGSHVKIRE